MKQNNVCDGAAVSNMVPTNYMWLFKLTCKLIHITFQVSTSRMWLVATILETVDIEHF